MEDFKYLGSIVQRNGECGREVKKRVQTGWNGWRIMSGVICDRIVPARVLYRLETLALTKRQEADPDGGGRVEYVAIFNRSDTNGQDRE